MNNTIKDIKQIKMKQRKLFICIIIIQLIICIFTIIDITKPSLYHCIDDKKSIIMPCYSVQEWYGLNNGRCVNKHISDPRKGCKTGWIKLVNNKVTDFNKHKIEIYGNNG